MKKLVFCIFCICLILTSCKYRTRVQGDEPQVYDPHSVSGGDPAKNEPYVMVDEENAYEQVSKIDWEKTLQDIPCDAYIPLQGFHTAPLSATLYKDGKEIELDVNDPRLIRFLNFYNNVVDCGVYSLSQGTANAEYEMTRQCDFRLELLFTPVKSGTQTIENSFDQMLIAKGEVFGVRTYTAFGDDDYAAFLRIPLHRVGDLNWLTVFGF